MLRPYSRGALRAPKSFVFLIIFNLAMHVILNEFEQGDPDYFVPENCKVALEFLDAAEQNFEGMKCKFLEQ
jgi:hypothetical protein